ncbi:MAG TPA: FAD-binding protein [Chitinophagaceae bacterium]|mgnify:CR=1 FL=1|nr:FAD-binding protein [Chitinophagaceae bacterium]
MNVKEKLPVSYLLFTFHDRISRLTYWVASIFIWSSFYILYNTLEHISNSATYFIYPILFWTLVAVAIKRLHDINRSGYWLWLIIIPVIGPLVLIYFLGFKKGTHSRNKYGNNPLLASDYFKNDVITPIKKSLNEETLIVNDVTQLNPIEVTSIKIPHTKEELQEIIQYSDLPISIGGGRFSMGGQTASAKTLHIDMRKLNAILEFSPEKKTIKVEAGIRWCDIQKKIDSSNLSIKIMQTYANFTVGGSLSVNVHGRYMGLGSLILSVISLDLILENGNLIHASRTENYELFAATIGCYNAIAVIYAAEFELVENITVERVHIKMKQSEYFNFFQNKIRKNQEIVFHNADLYPPSYKNIRAVSWVKTTKKPTVKTRLMPLAAAYPIERYFIGAFSKSKFGKWRREFIIDPIIYLKQKVHWRNYEAGYDVAELEPESRKKSTFVLQEYFIPIHQIDVFTNNMSLIFKQYQVNVINVSIRHAFEENTSLLSWSQDEVFAFVIWYKQGVSQKEKESVGDWTRELIDAAIALNGSYYLPYQAHATESQFHKAYPNAKKLMQLKNKLDPNYKFRNIIWDTYYKPQAQ